jgi:holliday junction DNA helicase RuvA
MYAYIKGRIVARSLDSLIIENQGIGYRVFAAPELMDRFPARGEEALIHTHLYVREDIQALYGFPSAEDLGLFELLLGVSGVGPKVASAIVGSFTPGEFALAVITGDIKSLTQIRGIGRKGAERLVLELKDKLKGADIPAAQQAAGPIGDGRLPHQTEAISALMVLGYTGTEAAKAVGVVYEPDRSLEDLIRLALRQLMR